MKVVLSNSSLRSVDVKRTKILIRIRNIKMDIINNRENITQAETALHQLYETLNQNIDLQLINKYQVTPKNIDSIINIELVRIKENYEREEENFVAKMLLHNPIINENRPKEDRSSNKSSVQLQRLEACRKSRMNNKIKKAKSKFRHTFITAKLENSSTILNCIWDVITHAENKLIRGGLAPRTISDLRTSMGIQECR